MPQALDFIGSRRGRRRLLTVELGKLGERPWITHGRSIVPRPKRARRSDIRPARLIAERDRLREQLPAEERKGREARGRSE